LANQRKYSEWPFALGQGSPGLGPLKSLSRAALRRWKSSGQKAIHFIRYEARG
jgi:hypothetical protein